MKYVFPTAILAIFGLPALAEVPAHIVERGTLQLSVSGSYAPMEYVDPATGELTGVDIKLGNAIAERLGLTVEWTNTPFAQLITALTSGRTDFILSGLTDRASRRETMDFVNYMSSGAQFMVLDASDKTTMTDLCGGSVGAARSTSYPDLVQVWSDENCIPAGLPPVTFEGTASAIDARSQMQQGRIDAVVQGSETLPFTMSNDPDLYRALGDPFTTSLQGIAFRKDDVAFRNTVSATLAELMAEGTYAAILAEYGLEANALSEPTLNAGPQ